MLHAVFAEEHHITQVLAARRHGRHCGAVRGGGRGGGTRGATTYFVSCYAGCPARAARQLFKVMNTSLNYNSELAVKHVVQRLVRSAEYSAPSPEINICHKVSYKERHK